MSIKNPGPRHVVANLREVTVMYYRKASKRSKGQDLLLLMDFIDRLETHAIFYLFIFFLNIGEVNFA